MTADEDALFLPSFFIFGKKKEEINAAGDSTEAAGHRSDAAQEDRASSDED